MASDSGANSPSPNSRPARRRPARDGTSGGRIVASGALKRTCRNGAPSTSRRSSVGTKKSSGRVHHPPGEPRPAAVLGGRGRLQRRIGEAGRCAGRGSASTPAAASAPRHGERDHDRPGDADRAQHHELEQSTGPAGPSSTVRPEKKTARPAVATVAATASSIAAVVASAFWSQPRRPAPRGSGWS